MIRPSFLTRLLARWTPRRPPARAAAPMLFGALVLAGCGGGGSDEPTLETPPSVPHDAALYPMKARPQGQQEGETGFQAVRSDRGHGAEVPHAQ